MYKFMSIIPTLSPFSLYSHFRRLRCLTPASHHAVGGCRRPPAATTTVVVVVLVVLAVLVVL
jgi:hypothetical protein